jgi:tRNA(fMet)-specific endonuclease VapC
VYLLDTTTVSDFIRGNPSIINKLTTISQKWIYISSITKFEIEYGLVKKPELRPRLSVPIQTLYQSVGDLAFDSAVVPVASRIKHSLKSNELEIGVADLLIGAIAVHHDLIIVTSNVKHFENIEGLVVENWRAAS